MDSFDDLVSRALALAEPAGRRLVGITGAPGAGKSSLAERLTAAITERIGAEACALVPMDGFHLADELLRATGSRERKGAPDTFDRAGYVALLHRLRDEAGVIYAPRFDRAVEDSLAAAIAVPPSARLVITEGNYLLHWPEVRPLLDEVWYVDPPEDLRRQALIARHRAFGRSEAEAIARTDGPDQRNAEQIAARRCRADLIVGWFQR